MVFLSASPSFVYHYRISILLLLFPGEAFRSGDFIKGSALAGCEVGFPDKTAYEVGLCVRANQAQGVDGIESLGRL